MNKKLRNYITLFVAVLIAIVLTNFVIFDNVTYASVPDEKMEIADVPSWYASRDTLDNGGIVTKHFPTISYEVYVKPKNTQKVLMSKFDNQTYMIEMQKAKLIQPASDSPLKNFTLVYAIVLLALEAVVVVWILCMVFKLVQSIRKGEVFVTKVSKYLETTGILLTVLYLFQFIGSYVIMQYFIREVRLAGYYIVFRNDCNSMYIITGLALMIISQIILMGKDLKDEHDLTI